MSEAKVLVIVAEENLRLTFLELLELEGYTVSSTDNTTEGIEVVQQEQPDSILLDTTAETVAFIQQLREQPTTKRIPCIMLPNRTESKVILPPDDTIFVPHNPENLLETIKRCSPPREAESLTRLLSSFDGTEDT